MSEPRYQVRTADGTMDFPTLEDLQVAYRSGLIGAQDDVLDVAMGTWRKAAALPSLARSRPAASGEPFVKRHGLAAVAIFIGVLALILLVRSRADRLWVWPVVLVLALLVSSLLGRITVRAFKKARSTRR